MTQEDKHFKDILKELRSSDKSFKKHEKELEKTVKKMMEIKPEVNIDPNFKMRLQDELHRKARELKEEKRLKKAKGVGFFSSLPFLFKVAAPVMLMLIVAVFVGYNYIAKDSGGMLPIAVKPDEPAKLRLKPKDTYAYGIKSNTLFYLESSTELSEKKIEELVQFEPRVNFTAKRIKSLSLIPKAMAAESIEDDFEVKAVYELRTKAPLKEETVYKVKADKSDFVEREHQWAFQVTSEFKVKTTHPGNEAVQTPLNSVIEIGFNRPLGENAKDYFSIEPEVRGDFEIKDETLIFIPNKLESETLYSVKIAEGLISKEEEEAIQGEYSFQFETAKDENVSASKQKNFGLNTGYMEVKEGAELEIDLWVGKDIDKEFDVSLYRFDNYQEYIEVYKKSANWDIEWSFYSRQKDARTYTPKEDKLIGSYSMEAVDTDKGDKLRIPQELDQGYYFAQVSHGSNYEGVFIQSNNVGHYFTINEQNGLLWFNDLEKNEAISNAEIKIVKPDLSEESLGSTDGDGVIMIDTPQYLVGEIEEPYYLIVSEEGRQPKVVFIDPAFAGRYNKNDNYWNYLLSDRRVYQPKDKIQYWGILKGYQNNETENKKIEVKLLRGGYYNFRYAYDLSDEKKLVLSDEKIVSEFNTFEGEFDLNGLNPGNYSMLVIYNNEVASVRNIEVQTYQKPVYKITTEAYPKTVFAGDKVEYEVKVQFYDGTPYANADVRYRYNFYNIEKEGVITTDNQGMGRVSLEAPYVERANSPSFLNVTFYPESGEEGRIDTTASVMVFGVNKHLEATYKKESDERYRVLAKVNEISIWDEKADYINWEDKFLSAPAEGVKLKAEIYKNYSREVEVDSSLNEITKENEPVKRRINVDELTEVVEGETGQGGEWAFDVDLPKEEGVSYEIKIIGVDNNGREISKDIHIYNNSSSSGDYLRTKLKRNGYEASMYDNKFLPGDELEIEIMESESQDWEKFDKTLVIKTKNNILDYSIVDSNNYKDEFKDEDKPNIHFHLIKPTQKGYLISYQNAILDEKTHELNIELITDKEEYKPGDTAKINVKVTNPKRQKVRSRLNISVVDEAMYAHLMQEEQSIINALYRNVDYMALNGRTDYESEYGGGGMGGGGAERENFVDTALFKTVTTNGKGEAEIEFKVPDNLTSWRIMARAFEIEAIDAGESKKIINVSKGAFVDATLNSVYLKSDKPEIRLRFMGFSKDEKVEYSFKSESLGLDISGETSNQEEYIVLDNLISGEHRLEISAKQGDKEDVLIRSVKVLESYSIESKMEMYKVNEDLDDIKYNENGLTEVTFFANDNGNYYGSLNQKIYPRTIRLDEAAASLYAKQLLNEYYGKSFEKGDTDYSEYCEPRSKNQELCTQGLKLFPYGSADLELTVKILEMDREFFAKNSLKDYFLDVVNDKDSEKIEVIQALYGLSLLEEPVLSKINYFLAEKELLMEEKIYLALALTGLGDKESAIDLYKKEIRGALESADQTLYIKGTNSEKLTATLGMLVSKLDVKEDNIAIWNFVRKNDPTNSLDVLEEVIIADNSLKRDEIYNSSLEVKTEQKKVKLDFNKIHHHSMYLTKEEVENLEFDDLEGDVWMISYYEEKAEAGESSEDLAFKREYLVDGERKKSFKEGDLVEIRFTPNVDIPLNHTYSIVDTLPSGLRPVITLDPEIYQQRRGDSVKCNMAWQPRMVNNQLIYFDLNLSDEIQKECDISSYSYYARVVSKGVYKADMAVVQKAGDLNQVYYIKEEEIIVD